MQPYITNYMIVQSKQNMRSVFFKFFLSPRDCSVFLGLSSLPLPGEISQIRRRTARAWVD
jgi:hypothetical protein